MGNPSDFPHKFPLTGAILAGGRSSRMGRDKAFLPFPAPDGPPLIARQAALLLSLGIHDLVISGRPDVHYALAIPEARVVIDSVPDSGPLAGVAAILAAARHPWVLIIAVDLPHLTSGFLQTLIDAGNGRTGVVPQGPQGYEPLVALYPRSWLPAVQIALAKRHLRLQSLIQSAVADSTLTPLPISGRDLPLFANWNSVPDTLA